MNPARSAGSEASSPRRGAPAMRAWSMSPVRNRSRSASSRRTRSASSASSRREASNPWRTSASAAAAASSRPRACIADSFSRAATSRAAPSSASSWDSLHSK